MHPPPRFATPRRADRPTLAGAAAKLAATLGTPFMGWQDDVNAVALELDPATGDLAYGLVVVTVPRQQGKSLLMRVNAARACLARPSTRVDSTAQTRGDARDRWEEGAQAFQASPLAPLIRKVRVSIGDERIVWRNGSEWRVFPPTADGLHGASSDLIVIDECWAIDHRTIQAAQPAMAARRHRPQLWIISTAGDDTSTVLREYVELGRATHADPDPPMAFFEWSAGDDDDPDDPATWARCMPALGLTVRPDVIRQAYETMLPGEFQRAFLNRWTHAREQVIPAAWWTACADPASQLGPGVVFGLDVNPERSMAAIAVAGPATEGGRRHVELVDHRPGTDWLVGRAAELVKVHRAAGVVIDRQGPAATADVVDGLARRGVACSATNAGEYAAACARFYDAVRDRTLVHRAQTELDAAVAGAARRPLGDRWAWTRSKSTADITPLVAATLALDGLDRLPRPNVY